ncbi:hypothetical protein A3SI_17147 [Nitritalea halalkaliphila LW7]|uniref:NERD domain-containing protein n=1 Tax=Nitritalea halalkaliphila LW7 TaxID=1189621 RepID=I5BW90_9BACT|nr:nuclease-related domain-containing protein [Nitritalea halalkaliphila]EIM73842.1 hypothetical protein A3SI_17147 [Nitritalea halalkaliphila LW7]
MAVKVLLSRKFDHTHERIMFDEFCKKLFNHYHDSSELYLCIGNLHVEGREIDAVLIKRNAITIFEFKNYGGTLTFHENGDWPITTFEDGISNTVSVRGGAHENPYQQVRNNKFSLLNTLNLFANLQNTNLGHISGIVLFSKDIEFDPFSITPRIASWFHVTDLNHLIEKVNQITSTGINLSKDEIKDFQRIFNLGAEYEHTVPYEFQVQSIKDETNDPEEIALDNVVNETEVTDKNGINGNSVEDIIQGSGYNVIHRDLLPERPEEALSINDLSLSSGNQNYLNTAVGGKIYKHQYKALELLKEGYNVCLATSTSSGKSFSFLYSSA